MILDFYCPAVMLVIELDGAWHDTPEQKARDDERTALLNLKGYHVLRFRNDEVLENLGAVLAAIQKAAQS